MTTTKKPEPTFVREIELRYRKRRVKSDAPINEPLTDPKKVYALFSDLQNETKEKMLAISLDTKLKMLCFEIVAVGSINAIYLQPFEALRTPILVKGQGLILVHNHPSGEIEPSPADKRFTFNVFLHTIAGGMAFHDHVIIGNERYFSFAEHGLMKSIEKDARKRLYG